MTLMPIALALIWACAPLPQCKRVSKKDSGQAPVILASYAPREVRLGQTWRVYFRAEDPDGDMKDIVQILAIKGGTPRATAFTQIKEKDSEKLAGYLF